MIDSNLKLLRRTLDDLNGQLQNFGDRRDLVEVTEQYNQLLTKCGLYVDNSLLPSAVKGGIYGYQNRVSQLIAQVNQLRAQLEVVADGLDSASKQNTADNCASTDGKDKSYLKMLLGCWSFFNQNLVAQVIGSLLATAIIATLGYFGLRQPVKDQSPSERTVLRSQNQLKQNAEAPLVTFADGTKAYVNFTIVTRILQKDVDKVVSYGKNAEAVKAALEPSTVSAVHAALSNYSFIKAQKARKEIEFLLLKDLNAKYKAVGITLDSISLKDFRQLKPNEL